MQSNRIAYWRRKILRQPLGAENLMLVIDTLRGRVLPQLMDHMTDVMQQSRCDQCIGQALLSRMLGGLNRVCPLIDQAQSIRIQCT